MLQKRSQEDYRCKMWLSTRICAHTVTVAHTMNLLSSFVDWRKTYKGTPASLSGMVMSNKPKGAGKKGGKTKKRYSQSNGRKRTVTNYASPFDDQHVPTPSSPFQNTGFFSEMGKQMNFCMSREMPDANEN